VEDYYATGNQIIEMIACHTPPGFLNRVMGIQNIKGTGLDFVYRWQAWQACYHAAKPLREQNLMLTPKMLAPLAEFTDYGVLCAEYIRSEIAAVKNAPLHQSPQVIAELDAILNRLESAMSAIQQQIQSSGGKKTGWTTTLLLRLEEFLDCGDAVRRRNQADRIYDDLVAERISRDRAVAELQYRTQRQKGGWLLAKFAAKGKAKAAKAEATEAGKPDSTAKAKSSRP
jgi:hypothetical protein